MDSIKIGVVGVGHLGAYHLQKYRAIDVCTIVGVADIDHARRRSISSENHCRVCADYRELVGEVDAVSIAVPTEAHYAVARDFLADGL